MTTTVRATASGGTRRRAARQALVRRLLLVLATAIAPALLVAVPAHACSCADLPLPQHLADASLVVTGTVEELSGDGDRLVVVLVPDPDGARRPTSLPERVEVTTSASGAACGLDFLRVGERYLLVGQPGPGGTTTASLCGGSAPLTPEVRAALDRALPPGAAGTGPAGAATSTDGTGPAGGHAAGGEGAAPDAGPGTGPDAGPDGWPEPGSDGVASAAAVDATVAPEPVRDAPADRGPLVLGAVVALGALGTAAVVRRRRTVGP